MADAEGIVLAIDDAAIVAALDKLASAGGNLAPVMPAIAGAVLTSSQRRFEAEAGPRGVKWQPHAKSTLARMSKKRRARPFLLRDKVSPGLYSSIHAETTDTSAEVGTNLRYAAIHQLGGSIQQAERQQTSSFLYAKDGAGLNKEGLRVGSKLRFASARSRSKSKHERTYTVPARVIHIPARPYLGVDAADQAEILAIIQDHYSSLPGVEIAP